MSTSHEIPGQRRPAPAASADETIEIHGLYGEHGHCVGCVAITTKWIVPATADDRLCDECREVIADHAPEGRAPGRGTGVSTAAEWLVVRLHRLADLAGDAADWVERKWMR